MLRRNNILSFNCITWGDTDSDNQTSDPSGSSGRESTLVGATEIPTDILTDMMELEEMMEKLESR